MYFYFIGSGNRPQWKIFLNNVFIHNLWLILLSIIGNSISYWNKSASSSITAFSPPSYRWKLSATIMS